MSNGLFGGVLGEISTDRKNAKKVPEDGWVPITEGLVGRRVLMPGGAGPGVLEKIGERFFVRVKFGKSERYRIGVVGPVRLVK